MDYSDRKKSPEQIASEIHEMRMRLMELEHVTAGKTDEPNRKTILIIDDEVEMCKLLKGYIEERRPLYTVMMAHDGEQGEAMIADISPDLLILDINLPKKGGIKIFNDFSEGNTGRPKFPVFIFTVREELGDLFDDLDVDGFIHKPVQLDLVLKQIDRILSNIQKNVIFIVADPKSPHALDLKDIFRQEGFRVFIMNSWHSFVANARMHIPNFILFEYSAYENLPSEQFIAKITELKMKLSSESTWPPWHNPPVIVYGYGGIFKREECVNAGAHLFLIEPEAHKMIYEAVREIMLKRERERRDRAFIEELKQKIGKLEHEAKSTATIKDYKYFDPLLKKEEGGTK